MGYCDLDVKRRVSTKDVTEVPASWFGVLNSLFIIVFAPLFSKVVGE